MHPSDETDAANKSQNNRENPAVSALQSAERHVAGSPDAGSSCDGSGEAFAATFSALIDWAESRALIRVPADFDFFVRPPHEHGNEHEVWFDASSKRWFKATYLNRFGLAWGPGDSATPHEYLLRLLLQNYYFGDDIWLISLINCDGKVRVLTSQPHIAGDFATLEEIQKWFDQRGFRRIETEDRIAWYFKPENLLIADAHEGNVIRTAVGTLVPIDLNVIQPRGRLLEWVQLQTTGQVQLSFQF
jgi:hypothetical protein